MNRGIKVLFLCTGNACRSQMAEALLRRIGGERFIACSAGSHPAGYVHPLATTVMDEFGVDMIAPRSKSWDEFADAEIDVVITLCDAAAVESCPNWPGAPLTAHWPHPDPVVLEGDERQRIAAAITVACELERKIEQLVALDFRTTPRDKLVEQIRRIGAA